MVGESTETVGAGVGGGSSGQKLPTLEEYGTNLTKLAEEVLFLLEVFFFIICVTIHLTLRPYLGECCVSCKKSSFILNNMFLLLQNSEVVPFISLKNGKCFIHASIMSST